MNAPPASPATPWWRSPLLHFLLLGGALFAAHQLLGREARQQIVISSARIGQLAADARLDLGIEADEAQQQALLEKEIDDQLLLAHALELGLQYQDPSRARLVELATFLEEDGSDGELVDRAVALELHRRDPKARQGLIDAAVARITAADEEYGPGEVPPDSVLEELLRTSPDAYRRPARYRLTQVFVAGEVEPAVAKARKLRSRWDDGGVGPEQAAAASDPSPLPAHPGFLTRRQILLRFGDGAAAVIERLPPEQWSEPVPAINGAHLFWLHERLPARLPPLEEVRREVVRNWLGIRHEVRLDMALENLRRRYRIEIEAPAGEMPSP